MELKTKIKILEILITAVNKKYDSVEDLMEDYSSLVSTLTNATSETVQKMYEALREIGILKIDSKT